VFPGAWRHPPRSDVPQNCNINVASGLLDVQKANVSSVALTLNQEVLDLEIGLW